MDGDELVDALAGFSLFADVARPDLEGLVHSFDEEWYSHGQRVLRQGFTGTGFHLIVQGEAAVLIDGEERTKLGRGDFFGEISVLLDEPPVADVVALTPLHCVVLARTDLREWLVANPSVCLRMLQAALRRLRAANLWRS
jgi:CRP-like cAMP-binding protein